MGKRRRSGPVVQPFTADDFQQLSEAERLLEDLLPAFDQAENCGVDCQQFRIFADELRQRLSAIKREFMTPPPK